MTFQECQIYIYMCQIYLSHPDMTANMKSMARQTLWENSHAEAMTSQLQAFLYNFPVLLIRSVWTLQPNFSPAIEH